MYQYRGYSINVFEQQEYVNQSFTISNRNGLVYRAECTLGEVYANTSAGALEGIKIIIDKQIAKN